MAASVHSLSYERDDLNFCPGLFLICLEIFPSSVPYLSLIFTSSVIAKSMDDLGLGRSFISFSCRRRLKARERKFQKIQLVSFLGCFLSVLLLVKSYHCSSVSYSNGALLECWSHSCNFPARSYKKRHFSFSCQPGREIRAIATFLIQYRVVLNSIVRSLRVREADKLKCWLAFHVRYIGRMS